jgi:membrane-associated HD superfamily phosphohydrolase
MPNIHDELHPDESARMIRGHVTQGLRLARQHRLPRVILDAIAEHHGTMSIAYFLHRARQQNEEPDLSLYTYPGPKPQSKETALLMLADGCESAVRASNDRSYEQIRVIVERIIQERIEQGQLDESPLTLQDLERARAAFCSVLNGLYHPRIEYPESSEVIPQTRAGLAVVQGRQSRERA